jgi:hypothetical protein
MNGGNNKFFSVLMLQTNQIIEIVPANQWTEETASKQDWEILISHKDL